MNVRLRLIRKEDYPLILAWRSNNLVYDGLYRQSLAQKPITWEEHLEWLKSRNADWRTFIAIYENRPVGVVTIGQLDHWSPEIGLYLGEITLWGKGIGTKMVQMGLAWLKDYSLSHPHIVACRTTILDDNIASKRVFEKCGFKCAGRARHKESWYVKMLEGQTD